MCHFSRNRVLEVSQTLYDCSHQTRNCAYYPKFVKVNDRVRQNTWMKYERTIKIANQYEKTTNSEKEVHKQVFRKSEHLFSHVAHVKIDELNVSVSTCTDFNNKIEK